MTTLPKTIVLHLGAHKTASTHLQRSLAGAKPDDVALFGPPQLRDSGDSLAERFGFPLDPTTGAVSLMSGREVLIEMAGGAHRLVLSDENFAGRIQTGWGKIPTPLYFTASKRIAALSQAVIAAGGPKVDLCLAIRDPAGYLTSCYSQILHGGRVVQPAKFMAKNALEAIDWVDYVRRLRAIPNISSVTVWRYEDYATIFGQICKAVVGTTAVPPLETRAQVRLSRAALDAVLIAKANKSENNVAAAAAIFPVSETSPPFTLYDDASQAASDTMYAAQWHQLVRMDGVTCLQAR